MGPTGGEASRTGGPEGWAEWTEGPDWQTMGAEGIMAQIPQPYIILSMEESDCHKASRKEKLSKSENQLSKVAFASCRKVE